MARERFRGDFGVETKAHATDIVTEADHEAHRHHEQREDQARMKVLEREAEWMGKSPQARQAKSKARIRAYDELVQINEARTKSSDAQIIIPPGERLGQNVIKFENVTKGFGDRLLIEDLSFDLPPGGIVGVIGPNGAGKTTLFKMITGQEKPDSCTITVADNPLPCSRFTASRILTES